ncbi:hypothetical protein CUJ83_09930 [Methanocella sp. CWC-04]|uniref:CHAD domain-containing protein n=1 Tax=Methanooceanicella nereidis TaxID=2052831 RepID=A0AAP2W6G8_9EURY|nr:CHAD domain-containing protein [Methanocella sp. CWC-04]MCD1295318.1 hypothetical protein [Methanocella sp. CWC-04]
MEKALKKTVKKTTKKIYDYKQPVLTFRDPEDLHQIRVKGRTLLTYLDVLSDEFEKERPGFIRLRSSLKKGIKSLGDLRDLDVLIEEMEKRAENMDVEDKELIGRWLDEKRSEREGIRIKAKKKLPKNIRPRWRTKMLIWANRRIPKLLKSVSLDEKIMWLRERFESSMISLGLDNRTPEDMDNEKFIEELHRVRINAKKLRYALSSLKDFIPGIDDDEIEDLKFFQDRLGHIHDLSVWAGQLRSYSSDHGEPDNIISSWRQEMYETLQEVNSRLKNRYSVNIIN